MNVAKTFALVSHTWEVKARVQECELDLARAAVPGDPSQTDPLDALHDCENTVAALSADNPRQQGRVERTRSHTANLVRLGPRASGSPEWQQDRAALQQIFAEMWEEESKLVGIRSRQFEDARLAAGGAFLLLALLTIGLAVITWSVRSRERGDLTRAHRELSEQRALLESIVESVGEGVLAIRTTREFIVFNASARSILGAPFPRDRLPSDWGALLTASYEDGTAMNPADQPLARAARGEAVQGLVYAIRPVEGDRETWVSASSRPIVDDEGRTIAGVVTLRDITEQRLQARTLKELALTDELTQLHNRRGFLLLADQHQRSAARSGLPFAILFADLDGLKQVNDRLGHGEGDRAIAAAGRVLRAVFRDSDIVARLGGDEFAVVLASVGPSESLILSDRLHAAIRAHNAREAAAHRVSMSIGFAFFDPEHPVSLEELLAEADRRMYIARRQQREQSQRTVGGSA